MRVRQSEIDARLARYAVTRDARDLWPEVGPRVFRAAEAELARVIATVLGDGGGPVTLRPPPGIEARALGIAASAAGVGALIGHWYETGRIAADREVAGVFAIHLEHGRRRAGRLRAELERLLADLAERRIQVFVLKGAHTAYRYFPEPGTRVMSDIDLLVRPEDWEPAREGLRGLGFAEGTDPRHPEQSFWSPPDPGSVRSLEYTDAGRPWSIDLHRSLDRTPFAGLTTTLGTPDFAAGEVWNEFGRRVRVLPQPLLLAYLALHASSHFYGMTQIRLVELVLVARRDFAARPEGWQAFVELVTRTRTGRFVFPALDLAERLVPGTVDPGVLEELAAAAPRRLRRLVRNTHPAWGQRLHPYPGLAERFVWIGSLREALAAFAWLAWPHDGRGWVGPRAAVVAQWQRVRRVVRRVVRWRVE